MMVWLLLAMALLAALVSVVLGRNLTRSLVAGHAALAALVLALVLAGVGYLALVVPILGGLALATLQLFGWMLVDVERDHLPPTDRPTAIARGLAFLLLVSALALLIDHAISLGSFEMTQASPRYASPQEIGVLFFGPMREVATLVGITLAAGLLTMLLLTRNEGEGD